MNSICLSVAADLRCQGLSRTEQFVLFAPSAVEILFPVALAFARSAQRTRWLLVLDGLVFPALATADLLAQVLPPLSTTPGVFAPLDTSLAAASAVPIATYTLFLVLYARAHLVPAVLPPRLARVATPSLIAAVPPTVAFSALGALLGLTHKTIGVPAGPDGMTRVMPTIGFSSLIMQRLALFFGAAALALLALLQVLLFFLSFLRIARGLHDERRIVARARKVSAADDASFMSDRSRERVHRFKGLPYVALGLKLGAIESLVGLFAAGFAGAVSRRVIRLFSRGFLVVGVIKGLNTLDDFDAFEADVRARRNASLAYRGKPGAAAATAAGTGWADGRWNDKVAGWDEYGFPRNSQMSRVSHFRPLHLLPDAVSSRPTSGSVYSSPGTVSASASASVPGSAPPVHEPFPNPWSQLASTRQNPRSAPAAPDQRVTVHYDAGGRTPPVLQVRFSTLSLGPMPVRTRGNTDTPNPFDAERDPHDLPNPHAPALYNNNSTQRSQNAQNTLLIQSQVLGSWRYNPSQPDQLPSIIPPGRPTAQGAINTNNNISINTNTNLPYPNTTTPTSPTTSTQRRTPTRTSRRYSTSNLPNRLSALVEDPREDAVSLRREGRTGRGSIDGADIARGVDVTSSLPGSNIVKQANIPATAPPNTTPRTNIHTNTNSILLPPRPPRSPYRTSLASTPVSAVPSFGGSPSVLESGFDSGSMSEFEGVGRAYAVDSPYTVSNAFPVTSGAPGASYTPYASYAAYNAPYTGSAPGTTSAPYTVSGAVPGAPYTVFGAVSGAPYPVSGAVASNRSGTPASLASGVSDTDVRMPFRDVSSESEASLSRESSRSTRDGGGVYSPPVAVSPEQNQWPTQYAYIPPNIHPTSAFSASTATPTAAAVATPSAFFPPTPGRPASTTSTIRPSPAPARGSTFSVATTYSVATVGTAASITEDLAAMRALAMQFPRPGGTRTGTPVESLAGRESRAVWGNADSNADVTGAEADVEADAHLSAAIRARAMVMSRGVKDGGVRSMRSLPSVSARRTAPRHGEGQGSLSSTNSRNSGFSSSSGSSYPIEDDIVASQGQGDGPSSSLKAASLAALAGRGVGQSGYGMMYATDGAHPYSQQHPYAYGQREQRHEVWEREQEQGQGQAQGDLGQAQYLTRPQQQPTPTATPTMETSRDRPRTLMPPSRPTESATTYTLTPSTTVFKPTPTPTIRKPARLKKPPPRSKTLASTPTLRTRDLELASTPTIPAALTSGQSTHTVVQTRRQERKGDGETDAGPHRIHTVRAPRTPRLMHVVHPEVRTSVSLTGKLEYAGGGGGGGGEGIGSGGASSAGVRMGSAGGYVGIGAGNRGRRPYGPVVDMGVAR